MAHWHAHANTSTERERKINGYKITQLHQEKYNAVLIESRRPLVPTKTDDKPRPHTPTRTTLIVTNNRRLKLFCVLLHKSRPTYSHWCHIGPGHLIFRHDTKSWAPMWWIYCVLLNLKRFHHVSCPIWGTVTWQRQRCDLWAITYHNYTCISMTHASPCLGEM